MRIIPVIDIYHGNAVHALMGLRKDYRPIKNQLCPNSDPIILASSLKLIYGFNELYIADLDSIMGQMNNFDIIRKISSSSGMNVMLDSGINDVSKAQKSMKLSISKIIVGTETLFDFDLLERILKIIGKENVIMSLDLKEDKIISTDPEICNQEIEELLGKVEAMGLTEIIVLDLTRVGSQKGVNISLIKRILNSVKIQIIVGGGIRDVKDLLILKELGVSGTLVSTGLHNLKIKREDLSLL